MNEDSKLIEKEHPMIKYCVACVMPSTKPDLNFDENGVCSACNSYSNRPQIDWQARSRDFYAIIQNFSNKKMSAWDCLVPVSGGKDSTIQVLKILELGFHPICITSTTCDQSDIGRRNLENIQKLGVDHISVTPDKVLRAKLNRIGLRTVGDISWAEHVGIFTIPVRMAVALGVPLIIWGENSQNEYGGPSSAASKSILDRRWLEEFGGLLGLRVSDLIENEGIEEKDLYFYQYPTASELESVGVTGIFLGHFFQWDSVSNALLAQAYGFQSYGKNVEGSMFDFENLDNYQHGIHDYFKFLKYGYGRASDHVSMQIRRGRISRTAGIKVVEKIEGKYPSSYIGKPLDLILREIDITLAEFDEICDRFTNRQIFEIDSSGNLVKDSDKNLRKINYDNIS